MSNTEDSEQVVLVLVGLVASGKSTFAEALQEHLPRFRRCNQDDLGNRREVERVARQSLQQGLSVCIDRTNFNAQQRNTWFNIAREFSVPSWVLVFDTPYEVCVERLRTRQNHPTIRDAGHGVMILERFRVEFEPPSPAEGYDRILSLKASERISAEYSSSELSTIIDRLKVSSPDTSLTGSAISRSRPYHGVGWRTTDRGGLPLTGSRGRGQRLTYGSNTRGRGSTSRGRGSQSDDWRKKVPPSS